METDKRQTKERSASGLWTPSHQLCLVFAIDLQMLITGYGVGFSSPCLAQVVEEGVLTPWELEWFAGSLVLGQVLGILMGPLWANWVGRRLACLLAAAASFASWIVLSSGHKGWVVLAGRAASGYSDSIIMPAGIIYISEVAEVRMRGTFLNTTGLAYGLGIALSYLVGGALSWRLAALLPPVICCVVIPVLVIMKESPVFLISKQREALGALQWYRREEGEEGSALILDELHDLESLAAGPKLSPSQTVVKLLSGGNRRPYLILLFLFAVHPLTGVYSITFFALDLFEKLGLGSLQAVAVSSAMARVVGTALSSVLMHRCGRRALYIPSSAVATLSMGLVGALLLIREENVGLDERLISWSMVAFIFLFMFSFGIAISSFPWVLMGEWFAPELASIVTSSLITIQFAFIFIAVQITSSMMTLLGPGGLFLYFSSVCALNTLFVALMVPETHGQTFSHFHTLK